MIRNKYIALYIKVIVLVIVSLQVSCSKYLDKKTSTNVAVPSTLDDLQAVLDDQSANGRSGQFPEFVADNYYVNTSTWTNLSEDLRNNYIWASNAVITTNYGISWGNPYSAIYEANFVLDQFPTIDYSEADVAKANNIKGTALFYRAFMFYGLAQVFCKPYTSTAATDLGIVLKTSSDVTASVSRATVQQTYDQIISDLKSAADLLPVTSLYNTRPNKYAAYALLGRVYLSMRDYSNALVNTNAVLSAYSTLLDYNSLSGTLPANPLSNGEILFLSSYILAETFNAEHTAIIDSTLYLSYNVNDWRRSMFYGDNGNGTAYWKGSYFGMSNYRIFDGVATDEVYLIRAECRARIGDVTGAMSDLNTLLRTRYKTGTFTDLTAADANDALNKVLVERRKELAFRGLRWSDLRRLNLEGANITLKRVINNTMYTLPPNDVRWVLLIPDVEISRSGITQNPR